MSKILILRQKYHQAVCQRAIFLKRGGTPSIADVGSDLSVKLANGIFAHIDHPLSFEQIPGQTAGKHFEEITRDFLADAMRLLKHIRPGQWQFSVQGNLANFDQYQHLAELTELIRASKQVHTALGDYIVKPDVVIARLPLSDDEINQNQIIIDAGESPRLSPLRTANFETALPLLHASISCKLTLRSDRSQNARTEGLNLIRNRKGHTPHIAVVTAEPMPTRISSLALGTGDIDCVYHFALSELVSAANDLKNEAVIELLEMMIEGKRLRDISDLPFDLAA